MAFALNNIPRNYCLHMFLKYAEKPHKVGNHYEGGCPICREGKSWGKKQRLRYFPEENYFFCHNEQRGWNPYQWMTSVTNWCYDELLSNVIAFSGEDFLEKVSLEQTFAVTNEQPELPNDSFDLTDPRQVQYYTDSHPIVSTALDYIRDRRLLTAVNTCGKFYLSLGDVAFRNRLIIPYYNNGKIEYFTTRTLQSNDPRPKYFGKFADKPIFNLRTVDSSIPYYFCFEGPIDSMFCRNALSITGVHMSDFQANQLRCYDMMMDRIWVLDNQRLDKTARDRTIKLATETKDKVFVWPPQLQKYKDFNQLAVALKWDEIPYQLIIDHAKSGTDLKLSV
jgi:hypothetical protein